MSALIVTLLGLLSGVMLLFHLKKYPTTKQKHDLKISIVIPARNEALRLPFLLESLKSTPHEVIVVDDESEDDTKQVALKYGVKVIHPKPRPEGIKGKPWALLNGVQEAKESVVLLLDADTTILQKGIERLISIYLENESPLSIQPYHHMKKNYERLSVIFNLVVVMASNTYQIFNKKKRITAFFGPAQMMRKDEFLKYASKKDVNTKVLEDIQLGKAILKDNIPIRSIIGYGLIKFRMYPEGIQAVLKGFGKNFATGAIAINPLITILISLWLSGIYASMNYFIQGLMSGDILLPMLLFLSQGLFLYQSSKRIGNFNASLIILFPLHAIFFLMTFVYSFFAIYVFKNNQWKGRRV